MNAGIRVIQKITAMMLVIVMTMVNFALVGKTAVSYAVDTIVTNNKNVVIKTYFVNGLGNQTENIDTTIDNKDLKLITEVSVNNDKGRGGYFKGTLSLSDANFKFKEGDFEDVYVSAGETKRIEKEVEFAETNDLTSTYLNQESNVVLNGVYVNSKKSYDIEGSSPVVINWKSLDTTQAEFEARLLTNSIFKVNEENKHILQLLLTNKITDNSYPVKNTQIELNVPEGAEKVSVHKRYTNATNGNKEFNESNYQYNQDENKITIDIDNYEQDGRIEWEKNTEDVFVVTMEFSEATILNVNSITANDKITLYDDKELVATETLDISGSVEGLVSGDLNENEKEIYKGKIYTGEDRNYTSTTSVYVDYVEAVKEIEVTENKSNFLVSDEEKDANIQIVKTTINKDEFDKILGVDGNISIEDQNGNIVGNLTNTSEVNENGDIVVSYGSDVTNIKITTSKPQAIGILNIVNEKKIAKTGYSREDIDDLTGIKDSSEVTYIKNDGRNSKVEFENTIELKQTFSKANINIEGTNSISTTRENQVIDLKVTLETNDESRDLYKNPTIKITFPKQIEKVSPKYKLLYAGGLEKDSADISKEDGKNVMTVKLNGEQTSYSGEAITGTVMEIYAEIEDMNELATSSIEDIVLDCTNENATQEINEENAKVNIISESAMILTNSEANSKVTTIGSNDSKAVDLAVGEDEKTDTISMKLINNEGSDISDLNVLGKIPTVEGNINLESEINTSADSTVYYTSIENPTADINDTNNEWKTEAIENAKSYLIHVDGLKMGEALDANYDISMDSDLDYNIETNAGYKALYTNALTGATNEVESSNLTFKTPNGEAVNTTIIAKVGNDTLKAGDEVKAGEIINYTVTLDNTSKKDLDNVSLVATVPEGTTLLERKSLMQDAEVDYDAEWDESTYVDPLANVDEEDLTINEEQNDNLNNLYVESNNKQTELNNLSIKKGEEITYTYMVKVNNDIEDGKISNAEASAVYGDEVSKTTMNHTLKQSPISVKLVPISRDNNEILDAGYHYYYGLKLINNTDENQNNITIDLNTNDLVSVDEITKMNDDNSEELKGTTIFVESLKPNEAIDYQIGVNINQPTDNLNIAEITAIAKDSSENIYRSMTVQESVEGVKIEASIESTVSSGKTNGYVSSGDKITYLINVKNTGKKDAENLQIKDQFSDYLELESVKLNGEDVEYTKQIQKDEKYSILEIESSLEAGKDLQLEIVGIVSKDLTPKEMLTISNKAIIFNQLEVAQTEEIDYLVESVGHIAQNNGENDTTYVVSGRVWVDTDSNGSKDNGEELLQGIKVYAINPNNNEIIKDNNGNIIEATTNSEGLYNLDLPQGEYLIIFEYDTQKYLVTKYEAEKVSDSNSSKAIKSNININGESKEVAVTDKISLTKSVANINLGLIEAKSFNLELNKYISKIIVSNSKGTNTYDQADKTSLAKVEIGSKVLSGSNVVIEYTIQVTNNGEASGYAKDIIDIVPSELKFSSTLNSDWYQADEEIHNASLSNTIINPGETKEVKLILTKTMTSSNTGLVNNRAKIGSSVSIAGIEVNSKDDESTADVILGIKTGGVVTYMLLTFTIVAIIGGVAYLINKFIINKRLDI